MRNDKVLVIVLSTIFVFTTCKVDFTPPEVTISSPAEGAFVTGNLTISGTASDAKAISKVEVKFGSTGSYIAATGTTSWSASYDTSSLPDGGLPITVRAVNENGIYAYAFVTVIVDNVGPIVNIVNPANNQAVSGFVPLIGTGAKVDAVQIRLDGGSWQTVNGSLVWSYVLDSTTLTETTHTLEARGIRTSPPATSQIVSVNFIVDQTVPSLSIDDSGSNPGAGDYLKGTVTFVGTASDANGVASVELSFDNGINWLPATTSNDWANWTCDVNSTLLSDGAKTLIVRAKDTTGLIGLLNIPVTVDNNAPTLTVSAPANGTIFYGNTARFEGTASDAVGVENISIKINNGSFVQVNGTNIWNYDYDITSLPNGDGSTHSATIRATDFAGNVQQTTITFGVDHTKPVFGGITGIANNGEYKGLITFNGSVTDADVGDGISSVKVKVDDGSFVVVDSFTSPGFSHSILTTLYSDGVKTVTIRAEDNFGGYTDKVYTVKFDNTAPFLDFLQPTDGIDIGGVVLIRGSIIEANTVETLEIKINDGSIVNWTNIKSSINNGAWSYLWDSTNAGFPLGNNTIYIRSTDKAGNLGEAQITVNKTNSIPGISITSPTHGSYQKGSIRINGNGSTGGGTTIDGVEVKIDNGSYAPATQNPNWTAWYYDIDTSTLSEGLHTITARITVDGTYTNTSSIEIVVDNTLPSLAFSSPLADAVVYGTITVTGTASDTNLDTVHISLNGGLNWDSVIGLEDFSYNWNTTTVPGSAQNNFELQIRARDKAGNQTIVSRNVNVRPYITTLSTSAATRGSSITITGYNFNNSTVNFAGRATPVTPTGQTSTSITVTVPNDAITGDVSVNTNGIPSNGVNLNIWALDTDFTNSTNYVSAFRVPGFTAIHTAYGAQSGNNRYLYYRRNTGTWQAFIQLDSGTGGNSFTYTAVAAANIDATEANNRVYVAAVRGGAEIKFARSTNNGGSFAAATTVSSGSYAYLSMVAKYINTVNYVYLSAYDATNKKLVLFTSSDGGISWSAAENVDTSADVGQFSSIALDTNNNPVIAYYDATNKRLKLAYKSGGSWTVRVVDSGVNNLGMYASMKVGSDNSVHISYFDADTADLKYARADSPAGVFVTETAYAPSMAGFFTSLALDAYNNPHIAMYEFSNNAIFYASKSAGSWTILTVPDTGITYPLTFTAIVIGSDGMPWLFYPAGTIRCARFIK